MSHSEKLKVAQPFSYATTSSINVLTRSRHRFVPRATWLQNPKPSSSLRVVSLPAHGLLDLSYLVKRLEIMKILIMQSPSSLPSLQPSLVQIFSASSQTPPFSIWKSSRILSVLEKVGRRFGNAYCLHHEGYDLSSRMVILALAAVKAWNLTRLTPENTFHIYTKQRYNYIFVYCQLFFLGYSTSMVATIPRI
jgi:hypothetical protein